MLWPSLARCFRARRRRSPSRIRDGKQRVRYKPHIRCNPYARHSPDAIQIRGNRTTIPSPRNCIPFAALRSHSPRRRFPWPILERVFVAIHRPAAGIPETGSGARRLWPIGPIGRERTAHDEQLRPHLDPLLSERGQRPVPKLLGLIQCRLSVIPGPSGRAPGICSLCGKLGNLWT